MHQKKGTTNKLDVMRMKRNITQIGLGFVLAPHQKNK